jgi:hypothetical protein
MTLTLNSLPAVAYVKDYTSARVASLRMFRPYNALGFLWT